MLLVMIDIEDVLHRIRRGELTVEQAMHQMHDASTADWDYFEKRCDYVAEDVRNRNRK